MALLVLPIVVLVVDHAVITREEQCLRHVYGALRRVPRDAPLALEPRVYDHPDGKTSTRTPDGMTATSHQRAHDRFAKVRATHERRAPPAPRTRLRPGSTSGREDDHGASRPGVGIAVLHLQASALGRKQALLMAASERAHDGDRPVRRIRSRGRRK
jgi:hypothetical protein